LCVYIWICFFFLVDGLIDTGSSLFMQQDEWVVCRVFQKSAGAKKFPSNQPRAVLNPYNLEMAPTHVVPSPMMQLGDPTQFHGGRNYMSNAELAELARVFRGGGGGGGSTSVNHLPMQPQLSYPLGGGCFTISGLNLNLGGAGAGPPPVLRAMAPAPTHPAAMHPQDHVNPSMMTGETSGYGTEMNHANPAGNRPYMGVDHCMDLENYWPSY
jgi:hypothetical protein